jgi:hypothetical protein
MRSPTSNIEAVARDICRKQYACLGRTDAKLAADVDRFWHCVAAELESGQIDEAGECVKAFDFNEGLEAYRDWRRRHPASDLLLNHPKYRSNPCTKRG